MSSTLTLLVDASVTTGMGHWTRSSTLAEELERRGWVIRVIHRADASESAWEDARSRGWETRTSEWIPEAVDSDCTRTVVLIDSYRISAAEINALQPASDGLIVIDDLADRGPFGADIVVNQNLGADSARYLMPPQTSLLLGPDFALLRRQFVEARAIGLERVRKAVRVRAVLVMMGGTDATGVLPSVTEACLLALPDAQIRAIAPPHAVNGLRHLTSERLTLLEPTPNIAAEMVRADLIISAGGTSIWELCATARPFGVVVVADNQVEATTLLEGAGATRIVGTQPVDTMATARMIADVASDGSALSAQANSAASIVDGRGCSRVANHIELLASREAVNSEEDENDRASPSS